MYVSHVDDVEKERVEMDGARGVWIQWLIAGREGAKNYALRLFTIEEGGVIPSHSHPWEHEVFVLEGEGVIGAGSEEKHVRAGSFAYIEPDIPHWYKNTGRGAWRFLCIIPMRGAGGR